MAAAAFSMGINRPALIVWKHPPIPSDFGRMPAQEHSTIIQIVDAAPIRGAVRPTHNILKCGVRLIK